LFIDQQEFEVIGAGLQADSYYLEVRGVATTGQVWSSSEPATDLNNWIGHPASISHQVNAADLVTSTLTYGEQHAQGASLSVSAGDRVYNDIRGAGYKVLETGVTEGEFFIKVEGYVFDDHGLSSKTGPKIQANDHISSIHEGNSEVLAGQDGVVRSKLLITDNAQELAKAVESGEQLFFDSRELTVESMSIDGDDFYLVVQGMISSGGIQKRSESVETTFVDLQQNAGETIDGISAAMEKISEQLAGYGATQNRLAYSVSNLMTVATQTESARSRIEDADFAVESARLAKAQVLQQSGAAMLAQANASSQLALSLIR